MRLHKFLFGEIRLSSFFKRVTSSLGVTQSALTTDIGFAPGLAFGDEGSAAFAFWGVLGGVLGTAGCFGGA